MRLWSGGTWAALGALGALALASAPWSLDPERLAERLNDSTPITEGARWQVPESATFRLFPRPMVDVSGLRLVDASGAEALSASAAAMALSPWRLLTGGFEIDEARLRNPKATLDLDAIQQRLGHLRPPLRRLIVKGGHARLVSRRLGLDGDFAPFSGWIAWADDPQALSFDVGGVWNGEAIRAQVVAFAPDKLAAGGAGRLEVTYSGKNESLKFRGQIDSAANPPISGDLALSAPSLAAAAAWIRLPASPWMSTLPLALSGQFGGSPSALTFADATLTLAGQKLDGSLGISRTDGRWTTSANLATDKIDLAALFAKPPEALDGDGAWSRLSPTGALDPALDLDLRISAGQMGWGTLALADAALEVNRRGGDWTFRVLDGNFGGGVLNGEVAVSGCALRCRERVRANLTHADLSKTLRPFGFALLSGRATVKVEATAEGDTPETIVATSNGTATLGADNGAISGCSFEEALRRSRRHPFDAARDLSSGETPFSVARADIVVKDGIAHLAQTRLAGPGVVIDGQGEIDLARRIWNLQFDAAQADLKGVPSPTGARMTLDLTGPWLAPILSVADSAP